VRNRIALGILGVSIGIGIVACASAPAATQVGVVRGIAVDLSGNALPGIVVSLRTADGKVLQSVTTGEGGAYEFPDVPVGQYQVFSEFAGYSTPQPIAVKVTPSGLALAPRLVLHSPGDPD
jgi:carboxypeptidase family protein